MSEVGIRRVHARYGMALLHVALAAVCVLFALESVVRHYNDIDTERLHADGELLLRPLRLNASDVAALVAFLHTLRGPVHDATAAQPVHCAQPVN